ncbi:MAG: hypothetical protein A2498_04375 [Lentisphaerae bacterium RIFOXYC12_FULL_60_16]|nr:MAG: hypothetical protein A2498_04375 [Lentisphaerae bacterium RIFOXYC12_FULL_60_16]OGV85542.1 MAG: hypothetical protein A2340_12625 [Lentisphaerae bacterium RIFOXYB12_FULL_60_10]
MNWIRSLMNSIVFAGIVALGIAVMAVPLYLDADRVLLGQAVPGTPSAWLWTGVGILVFALLFALTHASRRRQEQYLAYRKAEGMVNISTAAISEYLSKLAEEFPAILRMRPVVLAHRSTVDIVAELKVRADPQIHEVCEMLQKRIRESLANGLGITEVRQVEVTVKEIYTDHKPAA